MFGDKNSITRTEEFTVANDILDSTTYAQFSSTIEEVTEPKITNFFIKNIEDIEKHEKYKQNNWLYEKSIQITFIFLIFSGVFTFFYPKYWIIFIVPFLFFILTKCLLKLDFEKYSNLDSSSSPDNNKIRCIHCGNQKFKIFPFIKPKSPPPKHDLEYFCNSCNKFLFYKKL